MGDLGLSRRPDRKAPLIGRALLWITSVALARPRAVLLALAASLLPAVWLASRLEVTSSFLDLLPDTHPAVVEMREVMTEAGGGATVVAAIPAGDEARARRFAVDLAERLRREPRVRTVAARVDVDFLRRHRLFYLPAAKIDEIAETLREAIDHRIMREAGFLLEDDREAVDLGAIEEIRRAWQARMPTEYLRGKDGRYLYVLVALRGTTADLVFSRAAQADVERVTGAVAREVGLDPSEVRYAGSVPQRLADDRFLRADLARAGPIGLAAVVGLIVLWTRRPRNIVLLSAPLLVGLAWTFAFGEIAVGHLNMISGFLVSILGGLGIEYGIHLSARYVEERARVDHEATRPGLAGHLQLVESASLRVARTTGRSLVGAGATNGAVFFVLTGAVFRGFVEIGMIAGVGMLLVLASTVWGFPALNLLLERRWPSRAARPAEAERLGAAPQPGLRMPWPVRWAVLLLPPVMAAYSIHALATGAVRYHTDWRELGGDNPARELDRYVEESLDQPVRAAVIHLLDANGIQEVRDAVEEVRARHAGSGQPFQVERPVAVDDLVPPDQAARAEAIGRLRAQLLRLRPSYLTEDERRLRDEALHLTEARPFSLADAPASLKERFETASGRGTLVLLPTTGSFDTSGELVLWSQHVEELRAALKRRGVAASILSENWVAGSVFRIIQDDGPRVLLATYVVVLALLWLDLRSLGGALLVLLAMAIGHVCMAGAMKLLGMTLNFMSSAVVPIVVGVSVDNALHVYRRFRAEGAAALRWTARATFLSSATNLLGFGALAFAHHRGLQTVGELASIGIALAYFSTSVFFPVLLDTAERRSQVNAC